MLDDDPDTAVSKATAELEKYSDKFEHSYLALKRVKLGLVKSEGSDNAIYTAEIIGTYKPNPEYFEYMLKHLDGNLGVKPHTVLHTAQSLFHDHAQVNAFGLSNAWVDRQKLKDDDNWGATAKMDTPPEFNFYFNTMMEMANAVMKEKKLI